ncbi:protein disulfide oxidoreductase [Alkaliphilus crotonatoxidans]
MKLLNEQITSQLVNVFKEMKRDVTIALFTKADPCETCTETRLFMEELEALTPKLHLKHYDLEADAERAAQYKVQLAPSIALLNEKEQYLGIKFNGIPAGHEINSIIRGILEVSGAGKRLPESIEERIHNIRKPVNIKVFVTLGCPHCPGAVEKAHRLALENPLIEAEMIEAQTFHELSTHFNVSSVPKIVINDQYEFVGNQPLEAFIQAIEKAQIH